MNRNGLIAIVVCGMLVSTMIFVAYYFGNNSGYTKGYVEGKEQNDSILDENIYMAYLEGNNSGYAKGYSDGFQAAQNQSGSK